MEELYKIDHHLNLKDKIKRIDKYYQFSEENMSNKPEENKKWKDILETIMFQLDPQFNLLCLTNNKTEITKYLFNTRSTLMDDFIGKDLIKKYSFNTRAGLSKPNISVNLISSETNQSGLIFYSEYFTINIVLVDREKKLYYNVKEPILDQHYLMININNDDEKEEYLPPMSANSYLYKKEDLSSFIINFKETTKITDICDIVENVKNLNNIYKKEDTGKKKITSYKVADLQGLANANNIQIKTNQGKKKTKAQLYEELKDLL